MKKQLILIALLFITGMAYGQIPAANDTTLYSGSTSFTPQFRFKNVTLSGVNYRIPQVYNSLLGKYDTYITSKYLRAFYAPISNGTPNYVTKYTGTNTQGISSIYSNPNSSVVIGSSNPSALLDRSLTIVSDAATSPLPNRYGIAELKLSSFNNGSADRFSNIQISTNKGTEASSTYVSPGDLVGSIYFGQNAPGTDSLYSSSIIQSYATEAWVTGSARGSKLVFGTARNGFWNGDDVMVIDQNLNVGIGYSNNAVSDYYRLDVNGSGRYKNAIITDEWASPSFTGQTGNRMEMYYSTAGGGGQIASYDRTNNVTKPLAITASSLTLATTSVTAPFLTALKPVFTDVNKNLTSTGIGTSSQFLMGDGSLNSNTYYKSGDNVSFGTGGFAGHVTPTVTSTYDLGSSSLRWKDFYAGRISLATSSGGLPYESKTGTGSTFQFGQNAGSLGSDDSWGIYSTTYGSTHGNNPVFHINGVTGGIALPAYVGSGTDMMTINNVGVIGRQAIPSGGGGGTVVSVAVNTDNGLAGSSSGGANPALTLTTTVNGIVKGNGTALSAAVANTDYLPVANPIPTGTVLINSSSTSAARGYTFQSPSSSWGPQPSGAYFTPKDSTNAAADFSIKLWDGAGNANTVLNIDAVSKAASFSGVVKGITPVASDDLTTKAYVDGKIGIPAGSDGNIVSYHDGGAPVAIGRLSVQNSLDYYTPSSGGTVNLVNNHKSIIVLGGAALTINLPSSPQNGDTVSISFSAAIAAITWGNGTTSASTSTAGRTEMNLTYHAGSTTWW